MVEIEEVEDSDPEEMDIAEYDPGVSRPAAPQPPPPSIINPANIPMGSRAGAPSTTTTPQENKERSKHWQCVYPVYFDKSRTREEGRRVSKELAVENPLAREIAQAIAELGVNVVFEPMKTHPKDWANPGRCRVLVKEDGKAVSSVASNKHHLYVKIAQWLKAHPTTPQTPFKLKMQGMPPIKEPLPAPAIPRGWKMGTILPLHSMAVTGGGVSENFFKDMMAEMQGQGQGMPNAPSGSAADTNAGKSKKDKKKMKG